MVSGAPDYWLKGKLIELIETINRVKLVDEITKIVGITGITEITNIKNLESVDLIDAITAITTISNIVNVANIQSIDLIDRITLIDEITKIGEITTIRDLTHRPAEFIANASFSQGLTGWVNSGCNWMNVAYLYGKGYVHFPASTGCNIRQLFSIPIGVDWLQQIYLIISCSAPVGNCLSVTSQYTDGTTSVDVINVAPADTWVRRALSPTAGKYIEMLEFDHFGSYTMHTYLGDILMVF